MAGYKNSGAGAGGAGSTPVAVGTYASGLKSVLDLDDTLIEFGGDVTLIETVDAPELTTEGSLLVSKTATDVTFVSTQEQVVTGLTGTDYRVDELIIHCNGRNFLLSSNGVNDTVSLYYTDESDLTNMLPVLDGSPTGGNVYIADLRYAFDGVNRLMIATRKRYKVINTNTLEELTPWLEVTGATIQRFKTLSYNKKMEKFVFLGYSTNSGTKTLTIDIYTTEKYNNVLEFVTSSTIIYPYSTLYGEDDGTSGENETYHDGYYYYGLADDTTENKYFLFKIKEETWEITNEHNGILTYTVPNNAGMPVITKKGTKAFLISSANGNLEVAVQKADENTWSNIILPITNITAIERIVAVDGDTFIMFHSALGGRITITEDAFTTTRVLNDGLGTLDTDYRSELTVLPNGIFVISDFTNTVDTAILTKYSYNKTEIIKIPHFVNPTEANYIKVK